MGETYLFTSYGPALMCENKPVLFTILGNWSACLILEDFCFMRIFFYLSFSHCMCALVCVCVRSSYFW